MDIEQAALRLHGLNRIATTWGLLTADGVAFRAGEPEVLREQFGLAGVSGGDR